MPRSPNDLWAWAKQIDGYPETEWTFEVFLARIGALEGLFPLYFYEYASTYEDVLELLRRQRSLSEAGVPAYQLAAVSLGVEWFESGLRAIGGRLKMPAEGEPFRGRHRVVAIGWDNDGETLIFQNSWGDWGDQGLGYMPREYFEAHVDDVFVQRSALWGPSPASSAVFRELGSRQRDENAEATAWRTRNEEEVEEVIIHGKRHSIARFYTYSFRRQQVVHVAELRHPLRAAGRCHTFLDTEASPMKGVIEELFVLPRFRRRGYASLLEEDARRTVSALGCEMINISLYEADALPRTEPSAIAFGASAGYQWRRESGRRPNLVATATRSLRGS